MGFAFAMEGAKSDADFATFPDAGNGRPFGREPLVWGPEFASNSRAFFVAKNAYLRARSTQIRVAAAVRAMAAPTMAVKA